METTTRLRAYHAVAERPGSAITDVAERLGVDHSTASYHLRQLERRNRVVARPSGRSRAYFANGCGVCPYLQWALPRLRADAVEPALKALLEREEASGDPEGSLEGDGGVTAAELGRRGVPASAARWALRRLEAAGLAQRTGHGTYALAPGRRRCGERALERAPCQEWGRCAVSKSWHGNEEGGPSSRPGRSMATGPRQRGAWAGAVSRGRPSGRPRR